jgi:tetratricopeptide (TPR) repeat protein
VLLAGILGIAVATWRRSPATTFGIGWIVITLLPASNFVLPAGFIIAERTLLLPSVGAMIAVASAVPWLYQRIEGRREWQLLAATGLGVILALGVARSVARNRDWRDTFTLMQRAVEDTPENYRAHFMLGILYFERGNLTVGERHFQAALRLFPYDPHMLWTLAERYRSRGFCAPALRLYESFYSLMPPATARGLLGYADCLIQRGRPREARAATLKWLRLGGSIEEPRRLLARVRAAQDSLASNGTP